MTEGDEISGVTVTQEVIAFQGEVMLLSWAESHKGGRTGVFLFDDESEQHPLKSFTTKRGKRAGTRFVMVLVEIAEDETPVQQEKKGGPLSQSAAQICENEQFRRFLLDKYSERFSASTCLSDAEEAAQVLRIICRIQSRAELDHNPEAAKRFQELMKEYREWQA